MEKEVEKVKLKKFIQIVAVEKGMTITEVARASGRSQSTLSNMLTRGNANMKVLGEILKGMGEELTIVTKNGRTYKIDLE